MAYINADTLEYPVTEQQINDLFPLNVFGQPFQPPEPYAWVFPTPKLEVNSIAQYVVEVTPIKTDKGNWEQAWFVFDYDTDVAAARAAEAFEARKKILLRAVDRHLDAAAQARGYDDIKSAVGYATDPDPIFRAEGLGYQEWRSKILRFLYDTLAGVISGTIPEPTEAELLAMLPELEITYPEQGN